MKKEIKWFAHDCFDEHDSALIAMCCIYKMEGYGRWWRLMEMFRVEENYRFDIREVYAYKTLASRMMTSEAKARKFIADLINTYGLLQTDDAYIWSDKFIERMAYLEKKKLLMSERGRKGAAIMHAKRLQQAAGKQDASMQEPYLDIAHYTTPHHTTSQHTTEENPKPLQGLTAEEDDEETGPAHLHNPHHQPVPAAITPGSFAAHRAAVLADERRFVYPHIAARKITVQQLAQWVDAFNRILECRNELPKNEQDYRQHFGNWFKYRNTDTEDPNAITGIPLPRPQPAHNPHCYLKTPQQALAEQEQQLRDSIRLAEEEAAQAPPGSKQL